ncbi:Metallo-hydrolase/oxidoreductase [Saccharata proteae CBS 121410]|uniref:Metallo-hydrolase/oxidoreductase n=1 Tax=Saccharata proteae CBS 121410 TaxID=1314787 RepID=A0A9P4LVI5_9PEZI|nr:Metallo-hydrolase/oxidoreductase [Saccharata proteae CBS 121410]
MASKRKAAAMNAVDEEPVDPSDELLFYCLGGGNEVGRSSHIIQYKGKTVMLDAGMHPAYDGLAALPFYDEFDLSTVDVLLISHFHIDHAASLPYVLAKTNFKGRVFMTHPTKAIYKWLIQDSVRVGNMSSSSEQRIQLYTEADHLNTFPQIEAIDYYTTHTISSIRITPYPAGHVLGAAMFLIEIAGLKILFTGDYSREDDRHLVSATVPKGVNVDVLITESTFGISSHVPRLEREAALMKSITGIINRGGRALLPVFALGRAQELLLILDEYWHKHPEFRKIPIYYASNIARKCMVVYQTYISAMNDNIKRLFRERMAEAETSGDKGGPWDFRYVRSLKSLERFDDVGGCVMLASPGMLQNGVSRELLERWAPDQRNGVIMTGYSVEGTMGKMILNEPDQIQAVMTRGNAGRGGPGRREEQQIMLPRRCSVQEFSFAAHVDGTENREFIEEVSAPVVILVHGERHNMMRLKSKLLSMNADKTKPVKVFSPANCEELRIPFKADKIAKVVGKLAQIPPPLPYRNGKDADGSDGATEKGAEQQSAPQLVTGVLVQNDFKMSLMAPEDLREYAGLTTTTITCRQHLTLSAAGVALIRWALEGTFGSLKEVSIKDEAANGKAETNGNGTHKMEDADEEIDRSSTTFVVMDCVTIRCGAGGQVEVEWEGNMVNDGIADAVLAVLFTVESSPAAVRQSSSKHSHSHASAHQHNPHAASDIQTRYDRLLLFLEAQFGPTITPISHPKLPTTTTASTTTPSSPPLQPVSVAGLPKPSPDEFSPAEQAELKRLHSLGIPVPGIEIKIDERVARVWLETLEVETVPFMKSLQDRVAAIVDKAVETVAPIWGE